MQHFFNKAFLLFCVFITLNAAAQNTIQRVEPASWWTGMHNPKLQLMVYGHDIAQCAPKISYPGVTLQAVHKVENPNYLFLDITISPAAKPGTFDIHFTKKGEAGTVTKYTLSARSKDANRNLGVTSKDLIYLIMPDRFANGDKSNDVVPGMREGTMTRDSMYSRHGGDIQGVMDHLDYIKDLGITTVWMTPEVENDMPHASYHGYAVTDLYKIDPRYGTNELYRSYVEKCHALGLKVIKDVVPNHIGSEHWMMHDMPFKAWVHQWPHYTNSSYRDQPVMDPHASMADKKIMLDGWFVPTMPDMNESNAYVATYLTQNYIWWLEYAGIDGLRIDTYPYNDAAFMANWAMAVKAEFPHVTLFGETLVNSVLSQAFFTQGNTVSRGFDTHLNGVTDAQIKDAIAEAINGKPGWNDGANRLYATLALDFVYQDASRNVVFLDNHDMSRFMSVIGEDAVKFKSGIALLLTMRGIPQLYYGTELGMKNYSNPDGLVREDIRGGWAEDKVNKFTSAGRNERETDLHDYVRALANFRKSSSALQTGKLMQYLPQDGVYVYFRYDNQQTVMIAYNSNEKEAALKTERFAERMSISAGAKNVISGQMVNDVSGLKIPAKTTLVLELIQH